MNYELHSSNENLYLPGKPVAKKERKKEKENVTNLIK